jgi:heme exporter protein D
MMSEFFAMDGYAIYVWPSFILTILMLVWGMWSPWRQHKRLLARIRAGSGG